MRSKAHFKSHPLHPILVAFPIAFFIGTYIFDILSEIYDNQDYHQAAYYMNVAGIIGAVLAAIPGIIDYTYTVPPASSAKKRATKHALINVNVLIIFIVALVLKQSINVASGLMLLLETVGVVLLGIAGWMGGTLVHRNQIGVDIRYAGAGKWQEERIVTDERTVEVPAAAKLELNQMMLVIVNKQRIVIGRTETGLVAFSDTCTHRGGSLAGGSMICGTVQCPWHGSQFDVKTGVAKCGPENEGIGVFSVIEENWRVILSL